MDLAYCLYCLYEWLCRCYGPFEFSVNDFNHWAKTFLNDLSPSTVYDAFRLADLISEVNGNVIMNECEEPLLRINTDTFGDNIEVHVIAEELGLEPDDAHEKQ